jgi:DNA-binding Lrp family transcriptional regulator
VVNAIILLNIEYPHVGEVAQKLAAESGVTQVYSVAGQYDLVAHARVESNEALAQLVTERVATLRGIRSSETLIAFRVYSSGELEAAFEVGVD